MFSAIICWIVGHQWEDPVPVWVGKDMESIWIQACSRCDKAQVARDDSEKGVDDHADDT